MPRIQLRRDTSANWVASNPVLGDGELAVEHDTGRAKLGDGSTAWVTLPYLAPTVDPARLPDLSSIYARVLTPEAYGAKGDGTTDDGAALQAWLTALASGGVGWLAAKTYLTNRQLSLAEAGQRIQGQGDSTVLKAGAAIASILNVASVGGGRSVIEGIKFDGNGLATNAVTQTIASETSVGTRWVRCKFRGATGYQMVNNKCEDVTYLDCATDGDESSPSTIKHALQVVVPNGMVRIIGGEWFGRCDLSYQQISAYGAVIGPIFIENAGASTASILKLDSCYVYDGGVDNDNCINTGTNLTNINLTACYLVAQSQKNFMNGNMPNVNVRVQDCVFIQTAALGASPVSYVLNASGAGRVIIDGGNSSLTSGGALHAFNAVGGATTTTTTLVACVGLT